MRRIPVVPREQWQARVEAVGLVYPLTDHPDGTQSQYWDESAAYELTTAEVDHLEGVTNRLHGMCVEAARYLATGAMGDLGLPPGALPAVAESLAAGAPSLYGRFDLRFAGLDDGPAKVLEYNADTPTGLVEAAIAQWYWLRDVFPERDQWNSLHERLVQAWTRLRERTGRSRLHLAHSRADTSGEEWMTVAYLRDCAVQAGWETWGLQVEELGYDAATDRFVDLDDAPIDVCFALYPWEDMLWEDFGDAAVAAAAEGSTLWIEPLWKVVLSNKALLAALWHLYPGDENLLPAHLDSPGSMTEWVRKPLHGREGDNITIHAGGVDLTQPGDYGDEGWCYQQWCPLPEFDGSKAVIGSWVVDGRAAGCGVRESDSWITDYYARFLPHVMDAAAP